MITSFLLENQQVIYTTLAFAPLAICLIAHFWMMGRYGAHGDTYSKNDQQSGHSQ